MTITFTKMHGAGNDFIVVDDRAQTFPMEDVAFLRKIAARRTGIGCDGFLLIQSTYAADIRMRFINPDGGEVEMCGNGARCVARFAYELGLVSKKMMIQTEAGLVKAEVKGARVCLGLTPPTHLRTGLPLEMEWPIDYIDTGVPHAVAWVEDPAAIDVAASGRLIREDALFAPEGTNVNFARLEADGSITSRTYERGVEAETLACGTGAAAAATVAVAKGLAKSPVTVHCAGGFDLVIHSVPGAVSLTGDAEFVFDGEVEYGNRL